METVREVFVGIDAGKHEHVVNVGREWKVLNTMAGLRQLVEALLKLKPTLVVVESTGGYEQLLLEELWRSGIAVSRVNPRRTKAFANSLGHNAKTDSIDARMLRKFAEQIRPEPTPAPSVDVRKMKLLIDRRCQLVEMSTQEKNHLKAPLMDERARASIKRIIAVLKAEIKELDAQVIDTIKASNELRTKAAVLKKELGVGPVLTMMLLGDMPELGTISREKVAALVGVAPLDNQSGSFDGRRPIRGGRKHVRSVLYMATVTAIRCNQPLKAFFIGMVKRGKHKMIALIATMRRFLVVLNAAMRNLTQSTQMIKSGANLT